MCVVFYQVKNLAFDHSGTYLAIAGTDVRYAILLVHPTFLPFSPERLIKGRNKILLIKRKYKICKAVLHFAPIWSQTLFRVLNLELLYFLLQSVFVQTVARVVPV